MRGRIESVREVREYRKHDQSHAGRGQPSLMWERRLCRTIREKTQPHRTREREPGGCTGVDESLDHSVEQAGNQSQDQ